MNLRRLNPLWVLGKIRSRAVSALGLTRVLFFQGGDSLKKDDPNSLVEFELSGNPPAEFPWTISDVKIRKAAGHRLFALWRDERPVCYGWVSERSDFEVGELNGICKLERKAKWIWDCVTPASERGKGFYTSFLEALQARFPSDPLVIYCTSNNIASKRGILRAGFKLGARITRSVFGTRTHHLIHPTFGLVEFQPLRSRKRP